MPADPAAGVQETTSVGPVLFDEHVRVTQLLPDAAVCGVQEATGTLEVVTGAGHVVVVQLLPEAAAAGVQDPAGTFVVTTGAGQVVVV